MTEDNSKKEEELNEPELVALDSKDSLLEHLKDLMPKKEEAMPEFESYSFDLKNDDNFIINTGLYCEDCKHKD